MDLPSAGDIAAWRVQVKAAKRAYSCSSTVFSELLLSSRAERLSIASLWQAWLGREDENTELHFASPANQLVDHESVDMALD